MGEAEIRPTHTVRGPAVHRTAGPRTIYVAVCRDGNSPADQYSFALPSSMETVAPRRDKSCGRVANKFGLRT